MGLSSNLRYQTLNGLEFSLAGWLNPAAFKSAVVVLRGLNNVLGGTSFVLLARLTGSQSSSSKDMDPLTSAPKENTGVEDQTLVLKEHSS
jgi:protein quaking